MAKNVDKHETVRLAIINPDKCKPTDCNLECKRSCPINKMGKPCITVSKTSKHSEISEHLCIGCGSCQKKCPFKAINIINLPTAVSKNTVHRFGQNGFKLHRLPILKNNKIIGLIGINGVGKSTAMKILGSNIKMNLGRYDDKIDWKEIIDNFKGSELFGYFKELIDGKRRVSHKIQYIDLLPKMWEDDRSIRKNRDEPLTVEILLNVAAQELDLIKSVLKKETNISGLNEKEIINLFENFSLNDVIGKEMKKEKNKKFFDEINLKVKIFRHLDLKILLHKEISHLSGGELQRVAIAHSLLSFQHNNTFFLDEPTSFLDVKQRLSLAALLSEFVAFSNFAMLLIDHDLAFLDLGADLGHIIYGQPGSYGIISSPFTIKQGINIFLDGYLPTENMRFGKSLVFERKEHIEVKRQFKIEYPTIKYRVGDFSLEVDAGMFATSEVVLLLGENGTGKTTFLNLISGNLKSGNGGDGGDSSNGNNTNTNNTNTNEELPINFPELNISYKKQKIKPNLKIKLKDLLKKKAPMDEFISTQIYPHLKLDYLLEESLSNLSGGELQRVAILICLCREADLYLIDEPSAFLDAEQRIIVSKILRKFCYHKKKAMFVVEHDLIMATYLSDKVINFDGTPSKECYARSPKGLEAGMNTFLKSVEVTFRRDPSNNRPRVNKKNSVKDREQKESGRYYN